MSFRCQAIKMNGKQCRQCGDHIVLGFCNYHKNLRIEPIDKELFQLEPIESKPIKETNEYKDTYFDPFEEYRPKGFDKLPKHKQISIEAQHLDLRMTSKRAYTSFDRNVVLRTDDIVSYRFKIFKKSSPQLIIHYKQTTKLDKRLVATLKIYKPS